MSRSPGELRLKNGNRSSVEKRKFAIRLRLGVLLLDLMGRGDGVNFPDQSLSVVHQKLYNLRSSQFITQISPVSCSKIPQVYIDKRTLLFQKGLCKAEHLSHDIGED